MLILFLAFVSAAWLGWVFGLGAGPVHALLLISAVWGVSRLPWRSRV